MEVATVNNIPNGNDSRIQEMNATPTKKPKKVCFNMILILINLALLHVFYISFFVFSAGTVRTIEKRFELKSTQTGLMNSIEDIVQTAICIFPSYLGLRMHKLRLLSSFMAIAGIGILLTNIPYIMYGPKKLVPSISAETVSVGNSTISRKMALGLCVPGEEYVDSNCMDDSERNSNMFAYGIFILTNALVGLGTAGTNALSTSYIDENTSKASAPVYIGVFQASKGISPVIGSLMAAVVLKLPENLRESVVDTGSPNWIGAWWLGYAIIGSGILLMCIPLFFTPRHQPYYYTQQGKPPEPSTTKTGSRQTNPNSHQANQRSLQAKAGSQQPRLESAKQKLVIYIKTFFKDLRRLLTNKAFLAINASFVCFLYVIVGIFLNLGRYMEIHFRLSSSFANIVSGVSIMTSAIGTVIGGLLMKKFKPSTPTAAKVFAAACLVGAVSSFIKMFVTCDGTDIAGTWEPETHLLNVNLRCASNCSCGEKFYRPVCVNDQLNYFSPCHAGCLTRGLNGTFSDCSCVAADLTVKAGQCEGPCGTLYIYIIVMAVGAFISSLGKVPAIIVGLRVMDKDLRSLGLGLQTIFMNIFTFIPGPLVYGAFFDSSCIVWKKSCGKTGNCLLYDTHRFRLLMHGPTSGFQLAAAVFAILTYLLIRNNRSIDSEYEDVVLNNNKTDACLKDKDGKNECTDTVIYSTRL